MPDNQTSEKKRLTHKPFMSSDELIALMEENVEDYAIIVTDPQKQIINWSRGASACLVISRGDSREGSHASLHARRQMCRRSTPGVSHCLSERASYR